MDKCICIRKYPEYLPLFEIGGVYHYKYDEFSPEYVGLLTIEKSIDNIYVSVYYTEFLYPGHLFNQLDDLEFSFSKYFISLSHNRDRIIDEVLS